MFAWPSNYFQPPPPISHSWDSILAYAPSFPKAIRIAILPTILMDITLVHDSICFQCNIQLVTSTSDDVMLILGCIIDYNLTGPRQLCVTVKTTNSPPPPSNYCPRAQKRGGDSIPHTKSSIVCSGTVIDSCLIDVPHSVTSWCKY